MKKPVSITLTNLEANALLRLIAVANTQTLDTEPKDRLAGTWVANRIVALLMERPLPRPRGRKMDRIRATLTTLDKAVRNDS